MKSRTLLERCEQERDDSRREAYHAKRRIRDALSRYWNGQETTLREERQIDWMCVAGQMALALLGEEASQPIAPRDDTREPEDDDSDPETTARMWDGHYA